MTTAIRAGPLAIVAGALLATLLFSAAPASAGTKFSLHIGTGGTQLFIGHPVRHLGKVHVVPRGFKHRRGLAGHRLFRHRPFVHVRPHHRFGRQLHRPPSLPFGPPRFPHLAGRATVAKPSIVFIVPGHPRARFKTVVPHHRHGHPGWRR